MAWAGSGVFTEWVAASLRPDPEFRNAWSDAVYRMLVAFFDDQVTPDQAAPRPATIYGAGQWTLAREVIDPPAWPAGGKRLSPSPGISFGRNTDRLVTWPRFPWVIPGVSLLGVAGNLVHDAESGDVGQGVAFHDWGAGVDVTAGTLTITWPNAAGGGWFCLWFD